MALVRLLYRSDSELTGSDRAVREAAFAIADAAAVRNQAADVTGALMFTSGVFVQLLEGDSAAVEPIFERVCCDMRHRRIMLLDFSEIDVRVFDRWGMIAFEGDERARQLFPTITEATPFARRNRLSANMAVDVMRSLHAKRAAKPKRAATDRMIATDVAVSGFA